MIWRLASARFSLFDHCPAKVRESSDAVCCTFAMMFSLLICLLYATVYLKSSKNGVINMIMEYTIIEDCSPYYIRFTYPGIEKVIEYCSDEKFNYDNMIEESGQSFIHHKLPINKATDLLNLMPLMDKLSIMNERVSLFVTKGGRNYRPHKDGLNVRCGINYNISIKDDKCVTSWYDNEELSIYPIDTLNGRSREAAGFDSTKHTPLKSMTAVQGECVLFNTDIFHGFDNSQSNNTRVILTLRFNNPGIVYYDNVKKLLFDK